MSSKEYPEGTIRHWQDGDYIKAHLPIQPFSGGWIPLSTNVQLEKVGRECDTIAQEILKFKEPINGERYLDHDINEYVNSEGEKIFRSDDFKVYMGFSGAGRYAFRNEFSKLFMRNKMALSEAQNNELKQEQDRKGSELTSDEKKLIRSRVKENFKEEKLVFTTADGVELKSILESTLEKLKEGTNFKDPVLRESYESFSKTVNSLPDFYDKIKVKRKTKNDSLIELEKHFSSNFGVMDSSKSLADKKFQEYVKKYSKEISQDSLDEQIELFGVNMDMDADTFYGNIINKYNTLSEEDKAEVSESFKDLIYLRFVSKYGKSVEGDWKIDHLPAVQNLENLINNLPDGHFKTNDLLTIITNKNYSGGSHGGYAWYSAGEKRINFSADCISRSSSWGVLLNPTEFKSVALHEIGHAVSKKFGRDNEYDYKKFVVECGWSYEQVELRLGMTATGDAKDIKRGGSNEGVKLITDYSKKSPEEAFAEYYSFYNLNKKEIDTYLKTNDPSNLMKESRLTTKATTTVTPLSRVLSHKILSDHTQNEDFKTYRKAQSDVTVFNGKTEYMFVSPWKTFYSKDEKARVDVDKIRARKDSNQISVPPVVAVRDKDSYLIIDGANRNEVTRMNKKLTPALTISKELYSHLKGLSIPDGLISRMVITEMKDEMLKHQESPIKTIRGLNYRDDLIPVEQVLSNAKILRQMKKINESEVLQKAIDGLFYKANINIVTKAIIGGTISSEVLDIIKSRAGVYADTPENQRLKRVGQKYGSHAVEEQPKNKDKKGDESSPENKPKGLDEHAKTASQAALEATVKNSNDPKVREAAHIELDRRLKEEHVQEEKEVKGGEKKEVKKEDNTLTVDKKVEELSDKYKDIVNQALKDDFKDPDKTSKLNLRQNEYARYIKRTSQFIKAQKEVEIEEVKDLLGLKSEQEIKDFFGDGKIISIEREDEAVRVLTEDAYVERWFSESGNKKSVEMLEFILNPELDKGLGKGSDIFKNQVDSFKKQGFTELTTEAARTSIYNGYYTWARLGYTIANEKYQIQFNELVGKSKDVVIKNVKTLPELMSFKKGREFWRENGFSFKGKFDLADSSESMFVLNKYMEEKKNGKK